MYLIQYYDNDKNLFRNTRYIYNKENFYIKIQYNEALGQLGSSWFWTKSTLANSAQIEPSKTPFTFYTEENKIETASLSKSLKTNKENMKPLIHFY